MVVIGLAALSVGGCAGKGEHLAVNLQAIMSTAPPTKPTGALTVAVATFEDASPQKGRLGSRSHLWGGTSYFDLKGGASSDAMTQVVVDYLKKRGWQVEKAASNAQAQVIISGKVLELSVNATSSFGSTNITAATKTTMEAVNVADGSKVRMTLTGAGAQSVFWFDPDDAQELLNETLSASLGKLIASTKVEGNTLRLQ
jgi:hypothetical protein